MKRTVSAVAAIALSVAILMTGCSKGTEQSGSGVVDRTAIAEANVKDKRVGTVKLSSAGQDIAPVGYKVFELHKGGKVDDLQAPISEDLAPGLSSLTYAPDFAAAISGGEQVEEPDYFVFDRNQESVFQSKNLSELEPGKHTVVMAVYWGNAVEYVGMWYYFNLEVK